MNLLRRLDAVQLRHGDIHDHHVRMQLQRQAYCLPSVCGIPDNTDVGLRLQQNAQAVAHHGVIVCQKDLDHGTPLLDITVNW